MTTSANAGGFQFTPATGLLDTTSYPTTPANETAARQQFMDLFYQLLNEINKPSTSAAAYAQYNQLINGNFDFWQRGTTWTNPANSVYTADRWITSINNTGVLPTTIVLSQVALTAGELFNSKYCYNVNVNGAGSGFGSSDYYIQQQRIEFGTSKLCGAGKKITVSLYAKSSIVGKRFAVSLQQVYGTGGTPTATEVCTPTATTIRTLTTGMVLYTFTFTTNTLAGKTFGTNNDDFLALGIWEMWGTVMSGSLLGGGTAETFVGSGNISFTEVQLNAGDQALPFQPRSFGDELQACLRYYEICGSGVMGQWNTAVQAKLYGSYKTQKRVIPTLGLLSTTPLIEEVSITDRTATAATMGTQDLTNRGFTIYVNGFASATVGNRAASRSDLFFADAEL